MRIFPLFWNPAQEYKKRHIAAKLLLKPGLKILDIGSGWGGLALDLAGISGADITGITLSKEQLRVARRRARESGLSDRVHFDLRDYRHQTGCFDRMWEFYLAVSEMAFREKDMMVFQMRLSKSRTAVPLTRDYITQWEHGYGEDAVLTG